MIFAVLTNEFAQTLCLPPRGRGTAAGFPETRLRVFGVRAEAVEGACATLFQHLLNQD